MKTARKCLELWTCLGLMAMLACGCSLRRMAEGQVANALASSGGTFASDDDPELVREAIPFGLKTMESLLADLPDHRGLLLALASGFTEYSYAFVQADADDVEAQDLAKATAMRTRARKLFLRARDYGLRGLEVTHRDFGKQLRDNPPGAVKAATLDDVPLLYWTGAAWAAAISSAKNDSKLMAELPAAAAMVQRALDLNEAWDGGSLHEFFIAYDGGRSAASASRSRSSYSSRRTPRPRSGRSRAPLRWANACGSGARSATGCRASAAHSSSTHPSRPTAVSSSTSRRRRPARW